MQRLPGILFVILYSITTLVCPFQDYSSLGSLPQMYTQCQDEDPDMDVTDFVLEHLMNLECLVSAFESDHTGEVEKPHQPFQKLHSVSQTPVVVSRPITVIEHKSTPEFNVRKSYTVHSVGFLPSDFLTKVFRPPVA